MGELNSYIREVVEELKPGDANFKSSAKRHLLDEPVEIWEKRADEPAYAKLRTQDDKSVARALNVYDQPIDLIELVDETVSREQSLYINGNPAVGDNPDRNKQHGFYFNADNCIGCHACESACAEKNETPAHLAFRSVGYVEGGSYPDFKRLNISMACNHCDDPVCLKGCPTAAYTKHTEYGAVLQDPDTCFGCGYCTWVCPYNAPQLDPVEGQVSKCNMCVDRLEVGLKPACVSACVGNALDFGVVEDLPAHREQANTQLPGFPDPAISKPNIRFQQTARLPEEMTRTDSAPIKYHLNPDTGLYQPGVDPKHGERKQWQLLALSSRENPLVLFTLCVQAAIGAFGLLMIGRITNIDALAPLFASHLYPVLVLGCAALAGLGLMLSTVHLGKPKRFYRGFNNLRYSPVSREGLGVAIFFATVALHGILALTPWQGVIITAMRYATASLALCGGAIGLYYMIVCYRIPARPFWNHWQTATAFCGSALTLGALFVTVPAIAIVAATPQHAGAILQLTGLLCGAGIAVELWGIFCHARYNRLAQHEGAASHYVQTTRFGKTYLARNTALAMLCLGFLALVFAGPLLANGSGTPIAVLLLMSLLILATTLVGRAMFYVLVIPTTMPGAFFWRNKGFAEHAQAVGLNNSVEAGLVCGGH